MKIPTLYPCIGLCVLLLAGCGGQAREEPVTPAPPTADADAQADAPPASETDMPALRVVVLGNSLSAGFGLDPEQAFPALLQQKVDSLGWDVVIVNAGLSGETTAGGLNRIIPGQRISSGMRWVSSYGQMSLNHRPWAPIMSP